MEFINPLTGELHELSSIPKAIALRQELKAQIEELRKILMQTELYIVEEMQKKEATKYQDDQFKLTLQKNVEYKYDDTKLWKLKDLIGEQRFGEICKVELKPYKSRLNQLMAYGGEIKELIESAVTEIPKPPILKVEEVVPV
jgi:16S rRNA C967 or C1407 C5-methylase (RsmB/RsmF family)